MAPVKKQLTPLEKIRMMQDLMGRQIGGVLPRGSMAKVAERFNVHHSTVKNHWKHHQYGIQHEKIQSHGLQGNTNACKYDWEALLEDLTDLPFHLRSTQASLATHLGVPLYFINRLVREEKIVQKSNFLKPQLTEQQQLACLLHVASLVHDIDVPAR